MDRKERRVKRTAGEPFYSFYVGNCLRCGWKYSQQQLVIEYGRNQVVHLACAFPGASEQNVEQVKHVKRVSKAASELNCRNCGEEDEVSTWFSVRLCKKCTKKFKKKVNRD